MLKSLCQVLSQLAGQGLFTLNCHRHTESSDFLGGLRPDRNGGSGDEIGESRHSAGLRFAWSDGPLVTAMRRGAVFLADEISLADDSVIERLNSVLEPERTVLLAEKIDTSATEVGWWRSQDLNIS
jgi:midasin